MALPYPIAPSQTDAKSPIDQQLMDAIRLDLNYLNTQIGSGGGGGATHFRVNGPLYPIRGRLSNGSGKKIDGAIVVAATTFSRARLSILKGGTSGSLEVDVLRNINVNHPITKIEAKYQGATQSIGRLGTALNTQSVSVATPNISTQVITKVKPALNIRSIVNIGNTSWLYTFTGSTPLDADYQIGDSMLFAGATDANNNGEKVITQVNYDGLPSVVVVNATGVEQNTATGTGILSMYSYQYLATVNSSFVVGESVTMAGHTLPANNGIKTIYAVNLGANNIVCKFAGGATQGTAVGTAACSRWVYTYSAAPDITHYVVGELALFASHTTPANNGNFLIKAVNAGGNNIIVTNTAGVTQAGAVGNVNTFRWVYATPVNVSSSIAVNDYVELTAHTTPANNGLFQVKVVNRNSVNNIEVYNVSGVAQAGIVGTITTGHKVVWFEVDYGTSYAAGTSEVLLEGIKSLTDNISNEFFVVEVNRGGFTNYNVVIDAQYLTLQAGAAGRVVLEARSIFTTRPKITVAQDGRVRNFQFDANAVFTIDAVPADSLLTMDIISIPLGLPDTILLSLS
jgi:hypothetical protein